MKYRIDVEKELKFAKLPNGKEVSNEATDCEMELWSEHVQISQLLENLQEVLADYRRLVRELDVAMNGEEGAARQASLVDLIAPAQKLRSERLRMISALREIDKLIEERRCGDLGRARMRKIIAVVLTEAENPST